MHEQSELRCEHLWEQGPQVIFICTGKICFHNLQGRKKPLLEPCLMLILKELACTLSTLVCKFAV